MVVKSLKSIQPIIWIPPTEGPNWKITVKRHDNTIDDITDYITDLEIVDGVTEGIGTFSVTLINADDAYTDVWTGMEEFTYYCDYGSATPTTKRFSGRVEKPANKNYMLTLSGRSESLFIFSKTVVESYEDVDIGYLVKHMFDKYGDSRYDTSSINVSTGVTVTFEFTDLPFWSALESACLAAGYDCYVDPYKVVQLFAAGSNINTTDGIVHSNNLVEVGDFAKDSRMVHNKIRVTGAIMEGVQIMYTANDLASQNSNLGIKTKKVHDEGLTTVAAAKEVGEYHLAQEKAAPQLGSIKGFLLASVKPGDMVWCSAPMDNVSPARYRVVSYKTEFKDMGQFTTLTLNKEPKKLSSVLKDRIQREHVSMGGSQNPDDLDQAIIELFNSDTGSHSNTYIGSGILFLSSGQSSGTWTSPTFDTADSNNAIKCRVSYYGDNVPSALLSISADNGITYQSIDRDTLTTLDNPGNKLKIKINITSATTRIDSLQVQYSTT